MNEIGAPLALIWPGSAGFGGGHAGRVGRNPFCQRDLCANRSASGLSLARAVRPPGIPYEVCCLVYLFAVLFDSYCRVF